jgi:enoyl-CoA hydratase/carnithine racemase
VTVPAGTGVDSSVLSVAKDLSGVWTATLSELGKRNALNLDLADALTSTVTELSAAGAKVLVLRSSGPVFCSGADLKGGSGGVDQALDAMMSCPVPVVASVAGPAIGAGVALVALATYAILADSVWTSFPEVERLGRFPVGVAAVLAPLSGMRVLTDVGLSGRRLSAAETVAAGWATRVTDIDSHDEQVHRFVADLAAQPADVLGQVQSAWIDWLAGRGVTAAGRMR